MFVCVYIFLFDCSCCIECKYKKHFFNLISCSYQIKISTLCSERTPLLCGIQTHDLNNHRVRLADNKCLCCNVFKGL